MSPWVKNFLIIGLGLSVLLIALGGIWYWKSRKVEESTPAVTEEEDEASATLGAEIFEKSENPIKDEVPETNPFEAETNPFEGAYQNPFE
ncbi:MAG: hypothetical protein HYS89_01070 [Candidatus Colwellbacteria bacterium]|nr:hypothetical protein [Candidatus Colwellbacteria bacterium]